MLLEHSLQCDRFISYDIIVIFFSLRIWQKRYSKTSKAIVKGAFPGLRQFFGNRKPFKNEEKCFFVSP